LYQDNSLLPREAIRLAALGILAAGPRSYAALAAEVRNFTSRIAGPSLELMGTSIELLRYEGFIAPAGAQADRSPQVDFVLTEEGRAELMQLLRAGLRPPMNDVGRLVLALKFRFMHLLPAGDRATQIAMMIEVCDIELARLVDLRGQHADEPGYLIEWLDREIGAVEDRLEWLRGFLVRIEPPADAPLRSGAGRR
jgi:DNA-binding PadR family transcriptional regulator